MKKIPSLFERDWDGDRSRVLPVVNPEAQWVIDGEGIPTRKRDGTAVLIRDGKMYARYDAKKGRTPPPDFEPCQEADPETGHRPGWVPVGDKPEYIHHRNAMFPGDEISEMADGTYELCGPGVNGNNEKLEHLHLFPHGYEEINPPPPRSFGDLLEWFKTHLVEGIVWHNGRWDVAVMRVVDRRMAKIKRKDFGLSWPG